MLDTARFRFSLVSHSPEVVECVRRVVHSEDYDIRYQVATFESAIPTAQEHLDAGAEVILCHGGSGKSIVRAIGHSVVAIDRTDMDVIKTLRQARTISRDIVLATFLEEQHDTAVMEELLDVTIHRVSYANWNELFAGVKQAFDRGVRVLVGGGISRQSMQSLGGTGFVIEPNATSILSALDQARVIARQQRMEAARRADLVAILKHLQEGVVCIDNTGALVFANQKASRLLKLRTGSGPEAMAAFHQSLLLLDVMADATPRHEMIVEIAREQFVVTAIPLIVHSGMPGAVALFRDVPSLQSINRKISDELYVKGFVARSGLVDILGRSAPVREMKRKIARFAATGATVLISGETGTGKELVAHALHAGSERSHKAFVAVNCAALPENLMESELFGYEDGAFTGAKRGGKMGLFEMAGGGTIFLDEVGEISHEMQLRLLRVLEAREVMRVGGSRIRPVDVRVICATHLALPDLVAAGRFRLDLYYRLSTLKIAVPALRERLDDIPLLMEKCLAQYAKPAQAVSPAMLDIMRGHRWPGNVRELLAMLESYLILLNGPGPDEALFAEVFRENCASLPGQAPGGAPGKPAASLKEHMERSKSAFIRQAVADHNGDKVLAARSLGISYTTLWRALQDTPA